MLNINFTIKKLMRIANTAVILAANHSAFELLKEKVELNMAMIEFIISKLNTHSENNKMNLE
jgi:hypothetical protein